MSTSTSLNRVAFQSNTTNGSTSILAIPNGTSKVAGFVAQNESATENAGLFVSAISQTESYISSTRRNSSGTSLPLNFKTGDTATTRLSIGVSGDVTVSNQLITNGQSWFNNNVNVGSTYYPAHLTVIGGLTSDAELYLGNTENNGVIAMDSGNSSYPVSMYLSNQGGVRSVELFGATSTQPSSIVVCSQDGSNIDIHLLGGDNSTRGGIISANGVNLNGDIHLEGATNASGNSITTLAGRSYIGENDVGIDIYPQHNGLIRITNLKIATKFTTDFNVSGNATLSSGTTTVYTNAITSNSVILLTVGTLGAVSAPKAIHWHNGVVGTSFDISSSDVTDTSIVSWFIIG
jgi:hypothetical protein